jgi:hypothetical protein
MFIELNFPSPIYIRPPFHPFLPVNHPSSLSLSLKMVLPSFNEEMYLSFAILILVFLYLFLVALESPWSNSGAWWLPLDSCFPTLTERMASMIDSKESWELGTEQHKNLH